jgi:Fe-S cluster assembly ATP-binding protein
MTGDRTHELVIEDLHAGVAGREILTGVDLVVRSGEIHAAMGPNGSGKSTLAHVLMGAPGYEVLGGRVTLDGHDVLALPTWQRARLGLFLAPQYPTEVPGVMLHAVLAEARAEIDAGASALDGHESAAHQDIARQVAEAADIEATRVGLSTALLHRPLNVELSGGERKRSETLQLAVMRPAIAILDELDSGLDVDGLQDVARRVRDQVDEWGLGVLAITHYRRLLKVLRPDVVHVFIKGRIVATGGPELAGELEQTGYAPYGGPAGVPPEGPHLEGGALA